MVHRRPAASPGRRIARGQRCRDNTALASCAGAPFKPESPMSKALRGAVTLCLAVACLSAVPALAQTLESERERISYMVGMDVGQSLEPIGPDLDFAAVERAAAQVLEGGGALVDGDASQAIGIR